MTSLPTSLHGPLHEPLPTRLHILHVINSLDGLGGAELALLRLIRHGASDRYRHRVVTLLGAARLQDEFLAAGAEVLSLDAGRGAVWQLPQRLGSLLNAAGAPARASGAPLARAAAGSDSGASLGRACETSHEHPPRADIVAGWLYYGNLAASLLGAAWGRPVLWNVRHSTHDLARSGVSTRIALALSAAAAAQPRVIVYNSATVQRQHAARRMGSSWSEVIENGIDTGRFRPDDLARARWRSAWGAGAGTRVIGRFGRFHALKGYADLIAAFARLRHRDDVLLVLGGREVDAGNRALGELIAASGIGARVRLLGERDDLHEVLPALDLFVSASHGESFPNVLAEAMACGVPGIATDVGASAGIVGDIGWLTPAGDVDRLAATIDHALGALAGQNVPLRERAALHIARHYSLAAMLKGYDRIFAALAASS